MRNPPQSRQNPICSGTFQCDDRRRAGAVGCRAGLAEYGQLRATTDAGLGGITVGSGTLWPGSAQPAAGMLRQEVGEQYRAEIRRTIHGIPHVSASNYGNLGFGFGFAAAEDNVCVMAEEFLTLAGERSRYLGAEGSYTALGQTINNLDSDFFYRSRVNARVVERLLDVAPQADPLGPSQHARALVRGYAAGYNQWLRHRVVKNVPDPRCRVASWVRPITAIDVWQRMYRLATLLGSSGVLPTTVAPRANAMRMSVPRRTPPSRRTGARPATDATTPGSASRLAIAASS